MPGADVKVILYKTIGVSANFSQDVKATVNYPIQLTVFNTDRSGGKLQGTTVNPSDYLKVNFQYSEGGADPLSGESLRQALVNYIQTRDNFLSEDDFYNIIEKYTTDFRILFKKMSVQENVFYLQRAFRNEYQNIIRSRNLLPEVFTDDVVISGIRFTSIENSGYLIPNTYYYKITAEDNFGNIITSEELTASLILESSDTGSIGIEWNDVPGVKRYKVYGRTQEYEHVWELTDNFMVDTGTESAAAINTEDIQEIEKHPYVIFPDFYTKTGQHYVSPFMYKFNEFYNYYEGWLFYPEMIVNFSSIGKSSQGEFNSARIPSIYLNLIYNIEEKKTTINLKSYQKLEDFVFNITIQELGIVNELMTKHQEDNNTYYYEYSENKGLIIDPIKINITATENGSIIFEGKTAEIHQRYDITDLLQIPVFKYMDVPYLVDVPVIDYDIFYSDKALYLDKILTFLKGFNFEELRLVSDSLQFRMLNTDSVSSYLLLNSLVQGKNLFKGLNYISKSNIKSIADIPETIPMNNDSWIIGSHPVEIRSTDVDEESVEAYQNSGYAGTGESLTFLTTSPYSITVDGNVTTKFSAAEIIRIKSSSIKSNNKTYHVLSSKYNEDLNKTVIYTTEALEPSENDGFVHYAVYKQWRPGGPDNIAKWNLDSESWSFYPLNINDIVTVSKPVHETFRYDSNYNFVDYELKLPLNLLITIYADRNAVSRYGVNLEDQRKQIKLEVAKYLQLYMSGTDIVYYPSAIIEFVMEPRRIWIKGITVRTFDSSDPKFEFINGIETYSEPKIRDNISSSKMEILKYGSAFYWWDVDNIEIKYNLDG